MSKETWIKNTGWNHLHVKFDNGIILSVLFGSGSYSDNHDYINDFKNDNRFREFLPETRTVELYVCENPKNTQSYIKKIAKKYGFDEYPLGYVSVKDALEIINSFNRYIPKETDKLSKEQQETKDAISRKQG